jgi:hypothetical protein
MRNHSFLILVLYLLAAVVSARAQPQNAHYVYDGKIVQVTDEELALAKYKRWQIWLYQEGVRIPEWSKNSNGLRWHNLRFRRLSSNRFR